MNTLKYFGLRRLANNQLRQSLGIISALPTISRKNSHLLFQLTVKTFARNLGVSSKKAIEAKSNLKESSTDPLANDLADIIDKFYNRAKIYSLELNPVPATDVPEYQDYYEEISSQLRSLDSENLEKFIRGICYFRINDERTSDVLNKVLLLHENKFVGACLTLYTLAKLDIRDESLQSKALKVVKDEDHKFEGSGKRVIIPLTYSLSELGISVKNINENIDKFVKGQIDSFNEYEISILFRFYSKLFYLNYEVLELLIKKCLESCQRFSLRYIIIITKCLAELNIRNLNLLTGIQDRLLKLIEINQKKKKIDELDRLDADSIAQILSNLVKLEFIDFNSFIQLEDMFFEFAQHEGIKNKNTIFTMFATHFKFSKMIKNEIIRFDNKSPKKNREYKDINEDFYEKLLPYLDQFKEDINFQTGYKLMTLLKFLKVTKRSNIRLFYQFYEFLLKKFFVADKVSAYEEEDIRKYVDIGFSIFTSDFYKKRIEEVLKELGIDLNAPKTESFDKNSSAVDNDQNEESNESLKQDLEESKDNTNIPQNKLNI